MRPDVLILPWVLVRWSQLSCIEDGGQEVVELLMAGALLSVEWCSMGLQALLDTMKKRYECMIGTCLAGTQLLISGINSYASICMSC